MADPTSTRTFTAPAAEYVPPVPPFVEMARTPPVTSGPKHDAPPRPSRLVWTIAALVLAAGVAGTAYLAVHFRAETGATAGMRVPGADLVVDKPSGWSSQDIHDAPRLVDVFLDSPGSPPRGLLFRQAETSIFVVHVPNHTGLEQVPLFPSTLGTLVVESQEAMTHALGTGRTLLVRGDVDGEFLSAETTVLVVADKIVVVGVLAPHDLGFDERAAAIAIRTSLRPA